MSKLAENIKSYRNKHNLTQTEFAKKLFVTKQAVSKWETGRGYPDSALIPEIAAVMDISIDTLMGNKRNYNKLIYLITGIVILSITFILIAPTIANNIKDDREFRAFTTSLEDQVNMDLPDDGELVSADFDNWQQYGNIINVSTMSYITYQNVEEVEEFEHELSNSNEWTDDLNDTLLNSIPTNIQSYGTIGDYYSVYNITSKTYNEVPVLPGNYDFVFLIYQIDNKRLVVLNYSIVIEEGE